MRGQEGTLCSVVAATARRFQAAGLETPMLDARLLAAHALDVTLQDVVLSPERRLGSRQAERFKVLIERRLRREPVARIIGRRGFWTLDLELSPQVLEPRPDSETAVEAVLDAVPDRASVLAILDLGVGSGALLLALLSEYSRGSGLGVDIAPQAVETARRNAQAHGLEKRARFQLGDWFAGVSGRFDVVVSNPPYVPTAQLAELSPEVRNYDPQTALDGGIDGLEAYRRLCLSCETFLAPGGTVVFEVGDGQAAAVAALLRAAGLERTWTRFDLGGRERCVCACRGER